MSIYETYKLKATEALLIEMAKYRAAELTLENNKTFFRITSIEYKELTEGVSVPEQKITHSYGGGGGSSITGPGLPPQNIETIIPAYTREFKIKRLEMNIDMNTQNGNEGALSANKIIDEREFR